MRIKKMTYEYSLITISMGLYIFNVTHMINGFQKWQFQHPQKWNNNQVDRAVGYGLAYTEYMPE